MATEPMNYSAAGKTTPPREEEEGNSTVTNNCSKHAGEVPQLDTPPVPAGPSPKQQDQTPNATSALRIQNTLQ